MRIINKRRKILKETVKRGFDPAFWFYRLRWNWYPKLGIVPRAPIHLDIEITNTCNLRCIMCVHGQGTVKNQGLMDVAFAKNLVDQAVEMKVASIKFNWRGEATLHKALPELIRYAKDRGIIDVQLNTNGTLLKDGLILELIKSGLDRIIFSLDAATKEVYERIRVGAKFEDVTGAIRKTFEIRKKLNRIKPFIRVQMVRMKGNENEESLFIKQWSIFSDEIRLNDVTNRGQGDNLFCGDKMAVGRIRCTQPWQRMVITWDGRVYPCCVDYFERWQVGDARKERLADIWKGPGMKRMREEQKKMHLDMIEPCKSCFSNDSFRWKITDQK